MSIELKNILLIAMEARRYTLKEDRVLLVREATDDDAGAKEYWGLGIGSLMLDTLIEWARETGIIRKINLRVRTDNRRAVRLYEGRGFVGEGKVSKEILLGGQYFDHYWMDLELEPKAGRLMRARKQSARRG